MQQELQELQEQGATGTTGATGQTRIRGYKLIFKILKKAGRM